MNEKVIKKLAISALILYSIVCIWIYFFKCNLVEDLRFFAWDVEFIWKPFADTFLNPKLDSIDVMIEILNVFGFIILGAIAYPVFIKKYPVLLSIGYCFLFSVFIEMMQLAFAFGTPIISDILLNVIGGVIGVFLAKLIYKRLNLKWLFVLYIICIVICSVAIILGITFTSIKWPSYISMVRI